MNSATKIAAALLFLGIAGCNHKVQSAAPPPPAPQKTVYTPEDVAKQPLPEPPPPEPVAVNQQPSETPQPPPPKPAKKKGHKRSTEAGAVQATKETVPTSAATTQEASAGQPANASPIGQLSSSGESSSTPTRQQVQELITKIQNALNGINRPLTSDEKQTTEQIRTFLDKAKKALDQDDLDGANTLTTKAKVLLDELPKG